MKKVLVLVMVAALATAASAAVFTEDFTGQTKQIDNTYYGARITGSGGPYGTWYMGNNGILPGPWLGMTDAFAQVAAVSNVNASRAAVIAIDGSGIAAGTYTLQWDFSQYGNATQTVQVWDVEANTGAYTLKYADGVPVNQVILEGDASATQLGVFSVSHPGGIGALNVTGQTLEFTYDGTGDIGLMFGISADTAWTPFLSFDNVSITAVPEPATMALLGLGGLLLRRRK